jgi:hypothetical protein
VAVVADNGVVSPVAPGSTSITVTTANGAHAASCEVTVKDRPQVSTFKLKCDTLGGKPVSGSKDGDRFTCRSGRRKSGIWVMKKSSLM